MEINKKITETKKEVIAKRICNIFGVPYMNQEKYADKKSHARKRKIILLIAEVLSSEARMQSKQEIYKINLSRKIYTLLYPDDNIYIDPHKVSAILKQEKVKARREHTNQIDGNNTETSEITLRRSTRNREMGTKWGRNGVGRCKIWHSFPEYHLVLSYPSPTQVLPNHLLEGAVFYTPGVPC